MTAPTDELSRELRPPRTAEAAVVEADRCLECGGGDARAPCRVGCPAGIDVPSFVAAIAAGDVAAAAQSIFAENILGGTCARVCPVEVLCQRLALPEAVLQTAAVAVMSGTAPPPSLTDLMPRIAPRSTFLIYAGRGAGGEELQPHYYEALSQPKTMRMISEAGHTGGLSARPTEYERRVVGFFERALFPGDEDAS